MLAAWATLDMSMTACGPSDSAKCGILHTFGAVIFRQLDVLAGAVIIAACFAIWFRNQLVHCYEIGLYFE